MSVGADRMRKWLRVIAVVLSLIATTMVFGFSAYVDGYALREALGAAIFMMSYYGIVYVGMCVGLSMVLDWILRRYEGVYVRVVMDVLSLIVATSVVVALISYVMVGVYGDEVDYWSLILLVLSSFVIFDVFDMTLVRNNARVSGS